MRRIHLRSVYRKSLKNYYRAFENMLNISEHNSVITQIMIENSSIIGLDDWEIELEDNRSLINLDNLY